LILPPPQAEKGREGDRGTPLASFWSKAMSVPFWDKGASGAGAVKVNRALVPITPTARNSSAAQPGGRASADFIAHLIATAGQAPQTRARRRAEPGEAVAAYRALGQWPTAPGHALSRSL